MAILNAYSTTQIVLGNSEDLYLGMSADLITGASSVETTSSGYHDIIINGAATSIDTIAVYLEDITGADVTIGATGSVTSSGNSAFRSSASSSVHVFNAGQVNAISNRGFDFYTASGDTGHSVYFTNTGTVTAYSHGVETSTGNSTATIDNAGEMICGGAVLNLDSGGASAHQVTNSGLMSSSSHSYSAIEVTESLVMSNSGTLHGHFGGLDVGGDLTLFNSGEISTPGVAVAADGTLSLTNSGHITGAVTSAGGADDVLNTGRIDGAIDLGAGDDLYTGRHATGGAEVDGGAGADTLTGGHFDDVLAGGEDADTLRGRGGDDALSGGAGEDVIRGGAGDDEISGGAASDHLRGGSGEDVFVYTGADVGKGPEADVIGDFHRAADLIDLSALGDMSFIGRHGYNGVAGEVRYSSPGHRVVVHVDVSGNGHDDLTIQLLHLGHLSEADFIF